MTLTDRDRRIVMFLIPIVLLVGYWFLLLSPKRDDLQTAKDTLAAAEQRRETAQARLSELQRARQTFAADYAAVVRLGKAIPSTVDAPGLLLQLDQAAEGTRIDFNSVSFGERATGVAVPATPQAPAGAEGAAAAGGAPAQTGPGQAAEGAAEGVNQANQSQGAGQTAQQGVDAATTPPSAEGATTPGQPATQAAAGSQTTPGALESVALTFDFTGSYFDLADFFHRLKRFVYVQDDRIFVRGRLLTIDTLTFGVSDSGQPESTPSGELTTTVGATVYLTPRAQGVTAGATPAGPAETPPAGQAPPAGTASKRSRTPTAAAVPLR